MKVIIIFLFLVVVPFSVSLAEEGTPCGESGGDISTAPSSTPSGDGGSNSTSDQIGLTGGTCIECKGPLGDDPWDRKARICSYDCDPDSHFIEEGMNEMFSTMETAAHQFVGALANFPSYQYDASHASVPSPQGY